MLKSNKIVVNITSRSQKHYELLGYTIPRSKDVNGVLRCRKGTTLLVKVCDLPKGSQVLVERECDVCFNVKKVQFKSLEKYVSGDKTYCHKCSGVLRTGEKNSNFKHGSSDYGNYKRGAKNRGCVFSITVVEFLEITKQDCHYCGCEPRLRMIKNKYFIANGIDRVDNTKGYILSNIVPCCTTCNIMKNNLQYDAFISHISQIIKNLKGGRDES